MRNRFKSLPVWLQYGAMLATIVLAIPTAWAISTTVVKSIANASARATVSMLLHSEATNSIVTVERFNEWRVEHAEWASDELVKIYTGIKSNEIIAIQTQQGLAFLSNEVMRTRR